MNSPEVYSTELHDKREVDSIFNALCNGSLLLNM